MVWPAAIPDLDNRDSYPSWMGDRATRILFRGAGQPHRICPRLHGLPAQIMQEIITMSVLAVFAVVVLKEPLTWRYAGAFACIAGAAAFMFVGRP
jgi:hypothetical protein